MSSTETCVLGFGIHSRTFSWLLMLAAIYLTCCLGIYFRSPTSMMSNIPDSGELHMETFSERQQSPDCSNDFFQKFFLKHHRFPDLIKWDSKYVSFSPFSCRVISQNISQCLKRKKLRRIAVYGDSQGIRYGSHLKEILIKVGFSCLRVKVENRSTIKNCADLNYFAGNNTALRSTMSIGQCHVCTGCSSVEFVCKSHKLKDIIKIEYINTEQVNTTYVLLNGSTEAPTYEHFIFDVYLRDSFPDLNVFFLPMNHIKRNPVKSFVDEFPKTLLPIVKKAKSPESDFFFISGTSEFEEAREDPRWKYRLWDGLLATDAIRKLNTEMFYLLESEIINATSKIYSFLDLVDVTLPLRHLSLDGVHFKPPWYSAFWKVFLDIYCYAKID
ncbi:hypothetical protein CAPTEDRAFT_207323 [Capitella teleta]|uniref:Uncharacterized protein n=1 Tax=Capitella teleta TaxID=283909 RepID=R7VEM4_CAPTE|nr:hypothetical protein CAPTEDRAFT_207323 [Capitella teleta]|eukprot:ELU14731.1 hypothetical protein CAPTEDRAFT_207323 [Capitella teleta]